jgi:hypothetical protein
MNQYPVKTIIDGRIVRNCRLVSEGQTTTLWRWDKVAGTAIVWLKTDDPPERIGATQNWKVGQLVVEQQRGCGCSHPMYTFVPPAAADA